MGSKETCIGPWHQRCEQWIHSSWIFYHQTQNETSTSGERVPFTGNWRRNQSLYSASCPLRSTFQVCLLVEIEGSTWKKSTLYGHWTIARGRFNLVWSQRKAKKPTSSFGCRRIVLYPRGKGREKEYMAVCLCLDDESSAKAKFQVSVVNHVSTAKSISKGCNETVCICLIVACRVRAFVHKMRTVTWLWSISGVGLARPRTVRLH